MRGISWKATSAAPLKFRKIASRLTGIRQKTALLHAGMEALIARASAERLAALGGTQKSLRPVRRRRSRRSA